MGAISFSHPHPKVGTLTIDNGVDQANWGYNLNTQTFPTYGGEVVQILSVYIDDLKLGGTCSTYKQIEAIYSYFASYFQVASQGTSATPNVTNTVKGAAFNLQPVLFTYPERGWQFQLYPKEAPGFRYGRDVVAPIWMINCHVIDNSPDLALITDGIKALATQQLADGAAIGTAFSLNGEISPKSSNPDTDPFQTYTPYQSGEQKIIKQYADYYNSLVPSYSAQEFGALTAGIGSKPAIGQTNPSAQTGTPSVPAPPTTQPKTSPGGGVKLKPTGGVPTVPNFFQGF